MATYQAPGVYVEEVPSAVQTIASSGTSTPGFIGQYSRTILYPIKNEDYDPSKKLDDGHAYKTLNLDLVNSPDMKPIQDALLNYGKAVTDAGKAATADDKAKAADAIKTAEGALNDALKALNTPDNNLPYSLQAFTCIPENAEVIFCTNFSDFTRNFGGFSIDAGQRQLVHAVYGFFANGGSSCYVARFNSDDPNGLDLVLDRFANIPDIAIVAAPGLIGQGNWGKIQQYCNKLQAYRVCVLDLPEVPNDGDPNPQLLKPGTTDGAPARDKNTAVYFPWIQVVDPATQLLDPQNYGKLGNGRPSNAGYIYVPPSGHMAGIYARTDTERGVHKAPANTPVRGIVGLRYNVGKPLQDALNPQGVNCIRPILGAFTLYGARTWGGDANGEFRYLNVRRTFVSIMKDIDNGTQWAVFEPNDQDLWAKIVMNVAAYLTRRWREGALFGATVATAFYVKCDAETNPSDQLELGMVTTLVGVAIVRPAEFVIFQISQKPLVP
jgi:phage tail sheath protein FI